MDALLELVRPCNRSRINPRTRQSLAENEFPEVLVLCHERRVESPRLGEHGVVQRARSKFGDVDNAVSVGPEPFHDPAFNTFVAHQVHAAVSDSG